MIMKKRVFLFLLVLLFCLQLFSYSSQASQENIFQLKEKPFPTNEAVARLLGEAEQEPRWICATDGERLIGLFPAGGLEKTFFLYDEKSGTASFLPLTEEAIGELTSKPKFNPAVFNRFGNLHSPPDIATGGDGRYLLASTIDNFCILFDLEEKCTHWVGPYTNVTSAGSETAFAFSTMHDGIVRIDFSDRSVEPVLTYSDLHTKLPAMFVSLPAQAALDEQSLLLCLQKSSLKKEGDQQVISDTIRLCTLNLKDSEPEAAVSLPLDMPNGPSLLQAGGKTVLFLRNSLFFTDAPILLLVETENIQDADERLVIIEQADSSHAILMDADSYQAQFAKQEPKLQPYSAALSEDGELAAILLVNDSLDDTMFCLMDTKTLELQNVPLPDTVQGLLMSIIMYEDECWLAGLSPEAGMLRYQIVRK